MSSSHTVNLSQLHLYHQIDAYLKKMGSIEGQPRENNLSVDGDCVGWSFLFAYYHNTNKSKTFIDLQTYISTWDKNINTLKTNSGMPETLKNKYKNGIHLFEQTINDVSWFSQIKAKTFAHNYLSQNDRVEQFNYVADENHELHKVFSFLSYKNTNITAKELPDMLRISQQWENSSLDFGIYTTVNNVKMGHAVSVYVNEEGNFIYFDPNSADKSYETNSPELLSKKIFSALNNPQHTEVKDLSLYQFVNKNQSDHLLDVSKPNVSATSLNINVKTASKFVDLALKDHNLDPIYKLLSADQKNASTLIQKLGKDLLHESTEYGHSELTDLLVKTDPSLEPLKPNDIFDMDYLSSLFSKLTLKDSIIEHISESTSQASHFSPVLANALPEINVCNNPEIFSQL
jgi:hypothetical protein